MACSSPALRSGSYLCPAYPLYSFLPQFRFIMFHSQARLFCTCNMLFIPLLQMLYTNTHIADASLMFITLHFTSLRHSFISVGSSPPAAHNLACLAAASAAGLLWFLKPFHKALLETKTHSKPLRLTVAAYRRCTALYSAPWQAHAANSNRSSFHWL